MFKSHKKYLAVLILAQSALIFIAFNKMFVHPHNYMFKNKGDGLKNYFTFHTYLSSQNEDFLKVQKMNYPFGEYIYYTDNSPALAFPLKLISTYIIDLSPWSIQILNFISVFLLLVSTVLIFLILTRLLKTTWLALIFSLTLVWINPQNLRFNVGHINLAFSCILLLIIWLLIKVWEHRDRPKNYYWLLFLLLISTVVSSFLHLYYLMIIGSTISCFFFAWGVGHFKDKKFAATKIGTGLVISLLSIGIVLATIQMTDQYYDQRKSTPEGYGFIHWKTKVHALYTGDAFNTIRFPGAEDWVQLESRGYLGMFSLTAGCFILFGFLLRKTKIISVSKAYQNERPPRWLWYLLFTGFVLLMISLGEYYMIFKEDMPNIFNPFFYLSMITERIKQFRCLGRFNWIFFWAFNFYILWCVDRYWQHPMHKTIKYLIIAMLILVVSDTVDFIRFQNQDNLKNLLTNASTQTKVKALVDKVEVKKYQAALLLPFFHVGSENYNITTDPNEKHFQYAMQFSEVSGLPLLNSVMSRTSIDQTKALFSIFDEAPISQLLLDHLNDKPILVVVDKPLNSDYKWFRSKLEPARTTIVEGLKIIDKYQMRLLCEDETSKVYQWNIK